MVSLLHLWVPIVVSAVAVFVASAIIHMVIKYHNTDYRKLSNEDEVMASIGKSNPMPGQYIFPWAMGAEDCRKPEMVEKLTKGPVGLMFLRKPGPINVGPQLFQWFLTTLVISLLVAHIAGLSLAPGADHRTVFHMAALTAFLGYAGAQLQLAIWAGQPWSVTIKHMLDGLVYGLVTGAVFGWLWPK